MPTLQILGLAWGARRIVDWDATAVDRWDFVVFFRPVIMRFEWRGVELIEPQLDLLHTPMSMQSIVDSFREKAEGAPVRVSKPVCWPEYHRFGLIGG